MITIDREKLRKLAKATKQHDQYAAWSEWYKVGAWPSDVTAEDEEFIAACSPDVILSLLDRLDELERKEATDGR